MRDADLLRGLEESVKMGNVGVYTAIRDLWI
jgi:hypothetical protein